MGGGRMLRAMGRAMGAGMGGVQGAVSSASAAAGRAGKAPRLVSISSSSSSGSSQQSLAATSADAGVGRQNSSSPCICEGDGWESVMEEEMEDGGFRFADRFVFGPVPSKEEVVEAVSTIQQIFVPVTFSQVFEEGSSSTLDKDAVDKISVPDGAIHEDSAIESRSDWIEPVMQLHNTASEQSQKVIDAFHSLQINPSIQRMVVSLSSDKAVWDAVMKNDAVKELRESFYAEEDDKNTKIQKTDDSLDVPGRILRWILESTKAKIMEFFDNIGKIVGGIFHPQEKGKKMDAFEDAVRSSFMLSVVVFIVVVMFRVQRS